MKNGFTLVELSIVLVIIGLLIGGILVAQSLIDSAKINQAIRQIQQYDIAVSNFQEKFRQLPGDSDLFILAGNNDGDLEDTISGAGVPECGQASCDESMSFWKHLSDSKIINESYNNDHTANIVGGLNSPEFLDDALIAYGSPDDTTDYVKGWQFQVGDQSQLTVLSIDTKLDDGVPTTGICRFEDNGDHIDDYYLNINMMSTLGQPL